MQTLQPPTTSSRTTNEARRARRRRRQVLLPLDRAQTPHKLAWARGFPAAHHRQLTACTRSHHQQDMEPKLTSNRFGWSVRAAHSEAVAIAFKIRTTSQLGHSGV